MGQAHAAFAIDSSIREQWLACMARALVDAGVPDAVRPVIDQACQRMTAGMVNR
jgi:truncated hemoglobin YjbI